VLLSAIVVAFEKPALLARSLSAAQAALGRVAGPTELIVVLNDGSPAVPGTVPAGVVVVRGRRGLGFAGGAALGLEASRGEWVALVNDDCIVDLDAFEALLAAAAGRDDVGSVAAQVLFAGRAGMVNSAGLEIDELGVAREHRVGRDAASGGEAVEVFGASAALGLFRRTMLADVGGLDPSFFAYLEDADLAWRARMAGWRCLLAPSALAVHGHSSTLGHGASAKHYLVGRNRVRMLAKNGTGRQLRHALPRILAYDLLYVGYVAATRRTLAPLAGRLRGLAEWRAYREAGRSARVDLALPPSPGLKAALARNRVYLAG
jgi:GT2 family glycosyltransferase